MKTVKLGTLSVGQKFHFANRSVIYRVTEKARYTVAYTDGHGEYATKADSQVIKVRSSSPLG